MTTDEALKNGFLEDKKIVLKPSPRGSAMGITDERHIAYFQHDNCSTFFCLPRNERGDLVNIFKKEGELEYFEKELGLVLNVSKPGNFFETFQIKVTKDGALLKKGETFNALDPMDNIRIRVLKVQPTVAPSWERRKERNEYRWALIDESSLNKETESEFDSKTEFFMLVGKYSNTTNDLKNLLKVYLSSVNSSKKLQSDATKQMIMKELNAISEDKVKREGFIKIVEDNLFPMKQMVLDAMDCKAIQRQDESYIFTGESDTYTFNEIAKKLYDLKNDDDDLFFKIKSQIEQSKK